MLKITIVTETRRICLLLGLLIVFGVCIATAKTNDEPPHMKTPLVTGIPKPSKPLSDNAIATIYISQYNIKSRNEQTLTIALSKDQINKKIPNAIGIVRLPKNMIDVMDTNPNPNIIEINVPIDWIKTNAEGHQIKQLTKSHVIHISRNVTGKTIFKLPSVKSFYGEWVFFRHASHTVTGVTGKVDPDSHTSKDSLFRSYHERGIYLNNNDCIEFIADYIDNGKVYVWVAVYDNGKWVTPWDWLLIDVTNSLQCIDYYFFIDGNKYKIWLYDTKYGKWYYNEYTDKDDPSSEIEWLTGSTELYLSKLGKFDLETFPITTDNVWYDGSYHPPITAFMYWGKSEDKKYVYVSGWFDTYGRIISHHWSSNNI